MTALSWHPEPYPRSGGLAAAGFYKLLGRPRLDPLTVLVRETAQNSWDARASNREPVRFSIQGWQMLPEEMEALRGGVFTDAEKANPALQRTLSRRATVGLFITDRGTKGLGGPLVADQAADNYDWVDFVLNVGKANTHGHTGGTYGFGKTITYIVSNVKSVVIHSRTLNGTRPETRLIACAIGEEFTRNRRLHTGRHWWSEADQEDPLPLTGRAADQLAQDIGMPEFENGEFGTNILVLDPDLGHRTPQQAMTYLAEAVTWNLWPKLMEHGRRRAMMEVNVSWEGEDVPVPDPTDRPPLHGFAQAFRALLDKEAVGRRPDGLERTTIMCQRPLVEVGDLVTVPLVARPRADVDDGHDPSNSESPGPAAAVTGVCHHVALMRTPELIVDYLPGPSPVDGGTEWAAVFRSRDEVDKHFAAAEPPTHDSWQPDLLPRSQGKTIVKVGLERIRATLDTRWGTPADAKAESVAGSTAVVADDLAHLVRGFAGTGSGRIPRTETGSPQAPSSARVEFVRTGVELIQGLPSTVADLLVHHKRATAGTRLHIIAGVALDGSASDATLDPDLALVSVHVDGARIPVSGHRTVIDVPHAGSKVRVYVARSEDTSVSLDVRAEPMI